MLADQLLASADHKGPLKKTYELMGDSVRQAQRFVLAQDMIVAASNIGESMPSSIVQGLPLCRLPYPKTWFEYAGQHKPGTAQADKPIPHRVGLLTESPPEKPNQYMLSVCWTHAGALTSDVEVCPASVVLDFSKEGDLASEPMFAAQRNAINEAALVTAIHERGRPEDRRVLRKPAEIDAALFLSTRVSFIPCPYFAPVGMEIASRQGPEFLRKLILGGQGDVESEIITLVCTLMLLNSRNGTRSTPSDLTKINKNRSNKGVRPLLEHWTLHLNLSRIQENALRSSGVPSNELRAHLVRGHFKIRRTGIYWWSPFVRGSAKQGIVTKDYLVRINPARDG